MSRIDRRRNTRGLTIKHPRIFLQKSPDEKQTQNS
jgi:hypothetical protein